MDPHNFALTTSYEPVVGWIFRIYSRDEGFTLEEEHRHVGGLFSDCGVTTYVMLDRAEVLQVVEDASSPRGGLSMQ